MNPAQDNLPLQTEESVSPKLGLHPKPSPDHPEKWEVPGTKEQTYQYQLLISSKKKTKKKCFSFIQNKHQ